MLSFPHGMVIIYCVICMISFRMSRSMSSCSGSIRGDSVRLSKLAKAWSKDFVISSSSSDSNNNSSNNIIISALERSIPLLIDDPKSVPFVCRYRSDVITPLSTKQIHQLSEMLETHKSLKVLREKILSHIPFIPNNNSSSKSDNENDNSSDEDVLRFRVETSLSKNELEDLYAPYKPPSKGSLEERIKKENPQLVETMDRFWSHALQSNKKRSSDNGVLNAKLLVPREDAITLLANRISSHPTVMDAVLEYTRRYCRIETKKAKPKATTTTTTTNNNKKQDSSTSSNSKYQSYHDFHHPLQYLKDYQVLAIRRGANEKELKLGFDIDASRVESSCIRRSLVETGIIDIQNTNKNQINSNQNSIWKHAIHDAWTRLLRKRCTTRLWNQKCKLAESRAIVVFCDNLTKALLKPPPLQLLLKKETNTNNDDDDNNNNNNSKFVVLALDPGYQAGIKCALLDSNGQLLQPSNKYAALSAASSSSLCAIQFLRDYEKGKQRMIQLLQYCYEYPRRHKEHKKNDYSKENQNRIIVALGNGHGTQEARQLIQDASETSRIPIHSIELINEAGASVWSVTEGATTEFPNHEPSQIAAVSIGRRYLDPLGELVKIPPKSLGLGMYQHDLSANELDDKLHITSVDAVAEVGVNINSCSLDILQKVPGLSQKSALCEKIIRARPIYNRQQLLTDISGFGNKTFENCAAFIRIEHTTTTTATTNNNIDEKGKEHTIEELDSTLVHPESYDLARWLLMKFQWKLNDPSSIDEDIQSSNSHNNNRASQQKWIVANDFILQEAAKLHRVSKERVVSVIHHLIDSILCPDPRLVVVNNNDSSFSLDHHREDNNNDRNEQKNTVGSTKGCTIVPSSMFPKKNNYDALRKACPVRNIIGTVRNIVDFGAFIDFGIEKDGLIHRSKFNNNHGTSTSTSTSIDLDSLLVGQEIGIDILGISPNGHKIILSLAGTGYPAVVEEEHNGKNNLNDKNNISSSRNNKYNDKKRKLGNGDNNSHANKNNKRHRPNNPKNNTYKNRSATQKESMQIRKSKINTASRDNTGRSFSSSSSLSSTRRRKKNR